MPDADLQQPDETETSTKKSRKKDEKDEGEEDEEVESDHQDDNLKKWLRGLKYKKANGRASESIKKIGESSFYIGQALVCLQNFSFCFQFIYLF